MSTATLEQEAAAKAEKPQPQKKVWRMPDTSIGETVLWFEHGQRAEELRPRAAVVTAVFHNSVQLNVIDGGSQQFRIKETVRHIDDPGARPGEFTDDGAWDYTEQGKLLRKLLLENKLR